MRGVEEAPELIKKNVAFRKKKLKRGDRGRNLYKKRKKRENLKFQPPTRTERRSHVFVMLSTAKATNSRQKKPWDHGKD